jgi:hypothetical protein
VFGRRDKVLQLKAVVLSSSVEAISLSSTPHTIAERSAISARMVYSVRKLNISVKSGSGCYYMLTNQSFSSGRVPRRCFA